MRTGIPSYRIAPAFSFLAAVLSALPAFSQDYSAWSHHASFRMNTGASGAALPVDIQDFPLLLRLDTGNFDFPQAGPDGADIRFTGAGGVALAHEIERWDAALKKAEVWIRLPVVKAGTDTGGFVMHWGNPEAAAASNGKAVFDAAGGFLGVWHLSGNSVRDAAGASADGNVGLSTRGEGILAEGRVFASKDSGLSIAEGPGLRTGTSVTFSLWMNAETWAGREHVIMHKGDSLVEYALYQQGDSLIWAVGTASGPILAKVPAPSTGAWHHVAGTYDGAVSRLFIDGDQKKAVDHAGQLRAVPHALGLGSRPISEKPRDGFSGSLDEAALASRPRSGEWIRLAWRTQQAGSKVILPPVPIGNTPACTESFAMPKDTAVDEGSTISLAATADCATGFTWTAVSGPAPRMLDPETKTLTVPAPRVAKDTAVIFQFTARFGGTERSGSVRVRIRETVPDPLFEMPSIAAWNGRDTLVIRPIVVNLAAVKASKAPVIRYAWTLAQVEADTALRPDALLLRKAMAGGRLEIGLCADNGGTPFCGTMAILVTLPTALRRPLVLHDPYRPAPQWNAAGKRIMAPNSVENAGCCGIIRGSLLFGGSRGQEMANRAEGNHHPRE